MNFCNNLAIYMLPKQISDGGKGNVVTSPLSLNAVLNMVAAGSKGRTLVQLLNTLEANSIDELNLKSSQIMSLVVTDNNDDNGASFSTRNTRGGGPLLSIVNGVWTDLRFRLKPSFIEVMKKYYKADTRRVDLIYKPEQVIEEVNLWVENGTKGLIKNLLSFIPTGVIIFLANALYFKGAWKNAFEKSTTRDEDFHLLNGQKIKVPFMTSKTDESHFYGSFDGFKVLKLPYRCADDRDEASFNSPFKANNLYQQHYFSHLFGASKPNEQHYSSPFMVGKTNGQDYNIPFVVTNTNSQHYNSPFMANNMNAQHCNSTFMANEVINRNPTSPFMGSKINDQDMYDAMDDFKDHKVPQQNGDDHNEDKWKLSMYVFLPDERNGLENLLRKLNSEPSLLHQQCDKLGK